MRALVRSVVLVLPLLLGACTWVELTQQGEQVRIATADAVTACERVGKTTVHTLSKVAGLNRYDESMQDELNKLARNSAVELNGDTVVPISPIESGQQVFAVYRCGPSE